MSAKSILFSGTLPYTEPPDCKPGRQEVLVTLKKHGRFYRFVVRDKIVVEDPYLVLVKAAAFAISEGEPFSGQTPERSVRDFLIKSNVVI
jgi:hypothetical protein